MKIIEKFDQQTKKKMEKTNFPKIVKAKKVLFKIKCFFNDLYCICKS